MIQITEAERDQISADREELRLLREARAKLGGRPTKKIDWARRMNGSEKDLIAWIDYLEARILGESDGIEKTGEGSAQRGQAGEG